MKFSSALFVVLSSFVAAGFASSPAQVKGDMTETLIRVNNFDKDIAKFPMKGATEAQFLVIRKDGFDLTNSLETCITSLKDLKGDISDADATTISDIIKALLVVLQRSLQTLSEKNLAIKALGHSAETKAYLVILRGRTAIFCDVLIDKAPLALKGQAMMVKGAVDHHFAVAIAAY